MIRATPEAPTDERASLLAFASAAEQAAYRAGIEAGLRRAAAAPSQDGGADSPDPFDPVDLRRRSDGWTPEKQREFVEALADTGVIRHAAASVGMSEQSVSRLRRRANARAFDLACDAAQRIGARRTLSIAVERALEGQVRRHYYHGELRSEERVYDNKLLIYLIGKLGLGLDPQPAAKAVETRWEPWMDAIERGLPEPPAPPAPEPVHSLEDEFCGDELWEDDDSTWWTSFPPPADFDGEEEGRPGDPDYRRTLSDAEQEVIDADAAHDQAVTLARESARRDRYFGFGKEDFSSPCEAEPSEPSADKMAEAPALPPPPDG